MRPNPILNQKAFFGPRTKSPLEIPRRGLAHGMRHYCSHPLHDSPTLLPKIELENDDPSWVTAVKTITRRVAYTKDL